MSLILNPLSKDLVVAKPIEQIAAERLQELESDNRLIIERKRNGHAALLAIAGPGLSEIGIYSRSIQDLSERFVSQRELLRAMEIPAGTLLKAEQTCAVDGIEKPGIITRFAGSKPERSLALQTEFGGATLALFDVLLHKGESAAHLPYEDRLDIVANICARSQSSQIELVEVLEMSAKNAQQKSLAEKWEGLVFYDKQAATDFRNDGRHDYPPRPDGCWKWKDYLEGDFVAIGWRPSTSKRFAGMVKDVLIAQYHPDYPGELVPCGKVGVGLTTAERQEYTDDSLYPMVFEIKYETRTENNRLISARIMRRRTDKAPSECIGPPLTDITKAAT